jgi:hypothetical protein
MRWIPETRSTKWWIVAGISSLVIGTVLWLIRFGLLGQTFTGTNALRMLLLAVVASFSFGLAGYLGARWVWGLSTLGMAIGLAAMALYSNDRTGWEDLVSFAAFLMSTVFGLTVGLIAEIVAAVVRTARTRRGG